MNRAAILIISVVVICWTGGNNAKTLPSTLVKSLRQRGLDESLASVVIKAADESISTYSSQISPFLTPLECDVVKQALSELVDLRIDYEGGYTMAERKVAVFSRCEEYMDEMTSEERSEEHLSALSILGAFTFDRATQADFLESMLNCQQKVQIQMNEIGDVIVLPGDKGAHIILRKIDSAADAIVSFLKNVRSVPVNVEKLPLQLVYRRPGTIKEMVVVEASARLDAVASGAFGMSRAKMVKLIESGVVAVAFKPCTNAAQLLQAGQEILVRDHGRLVLQEVGTTAKQKYRVKLTKYT